ISLEDFRRFHEALGLRVPGATRFHPFFHEIVSVEMVEPTERPIELIRQVWPPLMLGDMMFSRGGCHVAGGSDHIVKDVAEHSILYWADRRKHRQCEDQSYGWGSNSQWRTALRRDYQTPTGYSYNVDGAESLNEASGVVEGVETTTWVELVRHRCVIRAELTAPDPYPYCYAYEEES
ncbi:MAG: hypothetical protein Q7V43_01460, partial [Myxococcales bacterium]|nr:hypothetical protein [Myxococcales bacterium]